MSRASKILEAQHRLNKTEQELMGHVTRKGFHSIEYAHGKGRKGGSFRWGTRELNAAISLRDKGLIHLEPAERGQSGMGRGSTIHWRSMNLRPVKPEE